MIELSEITQLLSSFLLSQVCVCVMPQSAAGGGSSSEWVLSIKLRVMKITISGMAHI